MHRLRDLLPPAPLALLAASLVGAAHAAQDADGRPPVVVEDTERMDPEVVALLDELVAAVEANPADGEAHAELGLAYEANTMWTPAEACYGNAVALLPEKPEWQYRRGVMRMNNGDLAGALEDLTAAGEELKSTMVVQARLGAALRLAGRLEEAEAAWRQAIASEEKLEEDVRFPQSRVGLAQVLLDLGRPAEAEELCREALELYPEYRHAHYTLGLALRDQGEDEEAELELARGVNAYPEFPPDPHRPRLSEYATGFNRSMMIVENDLQAGRLAEARESLAEILEKHPDHPLALNLAVRAEARAGERGAARALLERSIAVAPGSHAAYVEYTILLLGEINEVSQALGQLQQAAAAQPARREELEGRAAPLQSRLASLSQQAREMAAKAVELAPTLGRTHYYQALVAMQTAGNDQQKLQNALGGMQRALRLGCTEPQFYQQFATLYARLGRGREMLRYAKLDVERRPEDPGAHMFLIQALLSTQQHDAIPAAVRALEAVAGDDPAILQFAVQAWITIEEYDTATAAIDRLAEAAGDDPQWGQFVQQARSFIEQQRAAREPRPGPPPPPDDDGGDSSDSDGGL